MHQKQRRLRGRAMLMPADDTAAETWWRWYTGYGTATQLNLQQPWEGWFDGCNWASIFWLCVSQNISENWNPRPVSLINWSHILHFSCISRNSMLRNEHGNWSLVLDKSLVSVGSKCKTVWRETSKSKMHGIPVVTICFT